MDNRSYQGVERSPPRAQTNSDGGGGAIVLADVRGDDRVQPDLLLYGTLEERIPSNDHPLRPIRAIADAALAGPSVRFDEPYTERDRPSIAPERLLRAVLLRALCSIRSERLEYNLLNRWFVGLAMNDRAWSHAAFSKSRERLLAGDVAAAFFPP